MAATKIMIGLVLIVAAAGGRFDLVAVVTGGIGFCLVLSGAVYYLDALTGCLGDNGDPPDDAGGQ